MRKSTKLTKKTIKKYLNKKKTKNINSTGGGERRNPPLSSWNNGLTGCRNASVVLLVDDDDEDAEAEANYSGSGSASAGERVDPTDDRPADWLVGWMAKW